MTGAPEVERVAVEATVKVTVDREVLGGVGEGEVVAAGWKEEKNVR